MVSISVVSQKFIKNRNVMKTLLSIIISLACVFGLSLDSVARNTAKTEADLKEELLQLAKKLSIPSIQVTYTSPSETISFVVVNDDFYNIQGRHQEYQPITTESVYQAASISKPPMAYIALKLAEEGKLKLDKPVYKYYRPMLDLFADKESKKKAKKITAEMIMLHLTGLDNKTYKNIEYKGTPGEKYRYSGPAIHILDLAIGHILKKDLRFYSKDYIFDKIGMDHSNYYWLDEYDRTAVAGFWMDGRYRYRKSWRGSSNAAYTLRTTSEEYTKFIRWIMNGADLSKESNEKMFKEYFQMPSGDYQGLIWRKDKHPELGTIYHHRGNNRTHQGWMGFFPETKETLCFFINSETKTPDFISNVISAFMGNETPIISLRKKQ